MTLVLWKSTHRWLQRVFKSKFAQGLPWYVVDTIEFDLWYLQAVRTPTLTDVASVLVWLFPGEGGGRVNSGVLLSNQSNNSSLGEVTSSPPERSENANRTRRWNLRPRIFSKLYKAEPGVCIIPTFPYLYPSTYIIWNKFTMLIVICYSIANSWQIIVCFLKF